MNDFISNITHVSPRYNRVFCFEIRMYFIAGFSYDLEASTNGSCQPITL